MYASMDSQLTSAGPCLTSPLDAFESDISPRKVSPLYTAGLLVVAFVMVLLPALYIGMIVLVGFGVLHHLTHNTWLLSGAGVGFAKLVLYLGPAVVGGILVFFMLKPLLARQAEPPKPVSLDPACEPLLFAFVQRICQLVRAPMPSRIDVDCHVNASASLRSGLLSRDLVLTVGMPLVGGLTMQQFAGVLAHEFGHFAQGAGMRLTYVIRHVNYWFARVVYERDRWDVTLEHTAKNVDLRIAVVLHAARGCVWLTRRILWLLMHVGHAVSCFMLRQMEYDADTYEAKVAGSDAFESTAHRIELINVAATLAFKDVQQTWARGQLPENLPALIAHKTSTLPAQLKDEIARANCSTKTRWFDTHPCPNDRIRAVRALAEPGVFKLERPACELFADFDSLCRAATRKLYTHEWQLEFTEANLVAADEMLRESATREEADAAIRKFYGAVDFTLTPLFISTTLPQAGDVFALACEWQTARQRSESLRAEAEKASADCKAIERQLSDFYSAKYLTGAGFRITPREFGLSERTRSVSKQCQAVSAAICAAEDKLRHRMAEVDEFVVALRQRVTLALQLAKSRRAARQDSAINEETDSLIPVLVAVGAIMPLVREVGKRQGAFVLLAQNRNRHTKPDVVDSAMERLATELRQLIAKIQAALGNLKYPFTHPRGSITVAEYARYENPCGHEFERVFRDADAHVERLFALHYRLVGKILLAAELAENNLQVCQGHTSLANEG